MSAQRYPLAMEPGRIGSLTIRNRIYMSAQTTSFGITGVPNERHIAYLAERARGGLGLIFTEAVDVMEGHGYPETGLRLSIAADDTVPAYSRLVEAIHGEGAAIFIQLTQTGHTRFWAPSPVGVSPAAPRPREMTPKELADLKEAFVEAARRAVEAGFDGMEVHFGHGHLLHRFLSPVLNIRTDGYGGSDENRLRFPMEVLAAVRAEVGSDFPLGIRASTDDLGGLGPDEHMIVPALRHVIESGLTDFVNLSQGGANTSDMQVPDMTHPEAPFIVLTRRVLAQLPPTLVMTTGRFRWLETAEAILAEGGIDFIGMTRAHTADADIIAKSVRGDAAHVRPCVACNFCAERAVWSARGLSCMVNPRAGNEYRWRSVPQTPPAQHGHPDIVIGGGPAGMEFARVMAGFGRRVELYEARDRLGGQMIAAGSTGSRSDFNLLISYLENELERLGVGIFLGQEVDAEFVAQRSYRTMVVATGSRPPEMTLPGFGTLPHLHPDEFQGASGHTCLVDTEGSWRTVAAIEAWMERAQGRLTVVSVSPAFVEGVSSHFVRPPLVKRIAARGVAVLTDHEAVSFDGGCLTARSIYGGVERRIEGIDQIYAVANWQANQHLAKSLDEAGGSFEMIGDAQLPRDVLDAMRTAHELAIDLASAREASC